MHEIFSVLPLLMLALMRQCAFYLFGVGVSSEMAFLSFRLVENIEGAEAVLLC